jgi:hypothetical protein
MATSNMMRVIPQQNFTVDNSDEIDIVSEVKKSSTENEIDVVSEVKTGSIENETKSIKVRTPQQDEIKSWGSSDLSGKKASEGLKNWTVPEDRKEDKKDNKKINKTNKKQTKVIPINDKTEESLDYVPFPNGSTKTTSNTIKISTDASASSVTHKNQLKEIKLQYGPRSKEYKAALQQVGLHRKASLSTFKSDIARDS